MRGWAGVLAVIGAALVLAPSADAWTRVANLAYAVDLVGFRTQAGTELLAWEGGPAGLVPRDVIVLRVGGAPQPLATLADDVQFTEPPVVLQQPGGTLLLYYSTTSGVFRLASTDDGRSWIGPSATLLRPTERVLSGAVRPDGTPLLAVWDWSGDSDEQPVFEIVQGLDNEQRHTIGADVSGSLVVAPGNRAFLLATAAGVTYVQQLDATGEPVGAQVGLNALPMGPPLADRFGDVLVPAVRGRRLLVIAVGHRRVRTHVVARDLWLGWGAPLLLDPRGGVSSLWTVDRAYLAVRSTSRGARFEHRTRSHEPADGGSTSAGGLASTAAIAWSHGVDLFVAFDDRIVRERFRVG
jgi:hypothetical protein